MPWNIDRQEWRSTPRKGPPPRDSPLAERRTTHGERTPRKCAAEPLDWLEQPTHRSSGHSTHRSGRSTPRTARSAFNQWVRTPRKQDPAASSASPIAWPSSSGTIARANIDASARSSLRVSPFHSSHAHAEASTSSEEAHQAVGDANGFLLRLSAPFAELSLRSKLLLAAQPRMEVAAEPTSIDVHAACDPSSEVLDSLRPLTRLRVLATRAMEDGSERACVVLEGSGTPPQPSSVPACGLSTADLTAVMRWPLAANGGRVCTCSLAIHVYLFSNLTSEN